MNINVSLVEKDYWIMNVLHHLSKVFEFQMKRGELLYLKDLKLLTDFSEDIDLQIKPPENQLTFKVYYGKNHDKN